MSVNFSKILSEKFRSMGMCVARNWSYFIMIPLFLSILLATGLQRWRENNDLKYLFAPLNARHSKEEVTIEKLFPMDLSSNANMERMNRIPCLAIVLVTAKDQGSVLREDLYDEILQLDGIVRNVTVTRVTDLKYKDICAKNNMKCFENSILLLKDQVRGMQKGNYSIKYPLDKEKIFDLHLNSLFLGGVRVDDKNNVISAKALKLFYYLNDKTSYNNDIAYEWQRKFLDTLTRTSFRFIHVDKYTSISVKEELGKIMHRMLPRLQFATIAILLFSIATSLHNNWIESKPWIGLIALLSGGMALASSFGFILYLGVPFIASSGSIPFLILGVGMDDAFVFLASWKRTDPRKSVEERIGDVYWESAVSVTVTSLTNILAFSSGIFAPYRMIRCFCIYASTAVIFCYVYQLTFVGACMAVCGYVEKQNRHSLYFIRLEEPNKFPAWITGVFSVWKSENTKDISMWTQLGNLLSLRRIQILVLMTYAFHVSVGFWGMTQTDVIGDVSQSCAFDSYLMSYYVNDYQHFSRFKHRVQIVIDQEINYADVKIQKRIEKIFKTMREENLIEDSLTQSWLRSYLEFLNDERMSLVVNTYNVSDSYDFILLLRRIFLQHPAAENFRNDIKFDANYTSILGSRFFCQTNTIKNEEAEIDVIQKMRVVTDQLPFTAFPYVYFSFWVDDADLRVKFTAQMLGSVVLVVVVVFFVFMPDTVVTLSIVFSIISIEVSVLGYMALWNVELAQVSVIVLVMCAGFSVDYSVHLCYAYRQSRSLRNSIESVGHAIFQGSVTTLISLLPLAYPLAYVFVALFKVVFLVVLFSVLNALIILPVLLTLFDDVKQRNCCSSDEAIINNNDSNETNEQINLSFYSLETASVR